MIDCCGTRMCVFLDFDVQKFRVYQSGTEGPVCFFLHGGGFSALSWAVLSVSFVALFS